jgi:hypothetical protein
MLDGLNFGQKMAFMMLYLDFFLQNWKILKFSKENSEIYLKNGQNFV